MEDVVHDDEMAEELELEEGPGNPIWSGEVPGDEVDDAMAEELVGWLHENEPEIGAAVTNLATAVETMDVAGVESAKEELKAASQFLNPEYSDFTPAERTVAPAAIESRLEGGMVGEGAETPATPEVPGAKPEVPGAPPAKPPKPGAPPAKPEVPPKPGAVAAKPALPAGPPSPKKAIAAGIADVRHAGGPTPGPDFQDVAAGWTDSAKAKFFASVGGTFETCVATMTGVPGLEDPDAFCGALAGEEMLEEEVPEGLEV
jgi:hypothetical protein